MLQNYFKITIRNLMRNKVYSAINIVGLAIGVASCLLIFLYVQDELSYESHFDKADRIVRIAGEIEHEGQVNKFALSAPVLAPNLLKNFPELEHVTQLLSAGKQTIWYKDKSFTEDKLIFADSSFFDVFSYELVAGNPASALDEPQTMVVSEEMAQKYFGGAEEAMGKVLKFSRDPYRVTGVFRNEGHSHIQASGFLARSTFDKQRQDVLDGNNHWFNMSRYTYALLSNEAQIQPLQEKLHTFAETDVTPWIKENNLSASMKFVLQPLKSIHFNTTYEADLSPAGNITYIYIFAAVAVFLLLIASINYMNLATARSAKRAKEVGLRKVVGAYRSQIISQFIGESLLITLLAVILALALTQIMIPVFNSLTDKQFDSAFFLQTEVLLALLAIVVFIGVVAGSYPAIFLSGFKPIDVLKTDKAPKGGSATLRKTLVVLQFAISLIMIVGTIVVFSQMHFLKNRDLGFNKEQVLVIDIPTGDSTLVKQLPSIKNELLRNPSIEHVSNSDDIPAESLSNLLVFAEKDGQTLQNTMNVMFVDYDFLDAMGIELQQGRNYSKDFGTDLKGALLINEAAAKKMEWQEPLGKRLEVIDWDAKVIGVVKDFHTTSLHSNVEPLILALRPSSPGYLLVRIKPQDMASTISFIESKWRAFDPKHPMEYFFMDDHFDAQYRAEEKMLTVFGYFAGLTILIACLGLFGLASYTAEQRTKEIGIRKVLGSSNGSIVMLLSKDFALLVLIAIVLASPVAWYGMHKWLQDFAYRIDLSWWMFALAAVAALVIALATVSFQALKAALLDPVKAMRT
ncbi:ABC transporter permease [Pontibacter akesuensis]|uniref:Putative ABC transport system permease protein n=1 Tax=Pontibacter akesuensis TaxID=388950 RepID=A0A1I7H1S4_9BACT|nr:ABC transporter permease [Pontibacter akesuensis]GHA54030.1 ABC transporter permease [Pontibacter akesuensis]SFU54456.1 putative ABC transport system permease protein [Pontibacter akesuensis]